MAHELVAITSCCTEIAKLYSRESRKVAQRTYPELTVLSRLCHVIIQQLQRALAFLLTYELTNAADELRFSCVFISPPVLLSVRGLGQGLYLESKFFRREAFLPQ